MPKVGKKHYAYTAKGKKQAAAAAKRIWTTVKNGDKKRKTSR